MKKENIVKKIKSFYFLLCWSFFVFYITTFSVEQSDSINGFGIDKIVHLFLFLIFHYLFVSFLKNFIKINFLINLISIIFSVLFIFLIEYLQIFIPGRFYSDYDILFGFFGVFLSVLFVFLKNSKKCYNKNNEK